MMRLRAGNIAGLRFHHHRRLGDEAAAARGDLVGEGRVLGRVNSRQPARESGDGPTAAFQRAAMGRGVDAASKSRDDREAGAGQLARELCGHAQAVARAAPRADDADRVRVGRRPVAAEVEQGRRAGDAGQASAGSRGSRAAPRGRRASFISRNSGSISIVRSASASDAASFSPMCGIVTQLSGGRAPRGSSAEPNRASSAAVSFGPRPGTSARAR